MYIHKCTVAQLIKGLYSASRVAKVAHSRYQLTDSGLLMKTLVLPSCHWSGSMLTACIRCLIPSITVPFQRG